jgi:hypothetical protein
VVGPLTFDGCPGCTTTITRKLAAPGASIYFDSNVTFAGDTNVCPTPAYPSVLVDATNISLFGGVATSAGSGVAGIEISPGYSGDTVDVINIRWWGVKIHDVGGNGIYVGGSRNSAGTWLGTSNIDVDAEIWASGKLPQCDVHQVKGTGIHSAYIGGSPYDPPGTWMVQNSKFSLLEHDNVASVGDTQVGQSVYNTELWIRAYNQTYLGTTDWAAGSAIGLWTAAGGSYMTRNVTFHDVESNNTKGPTVVTGSLGSGPVTVEYGRATNALTNPATYTYYGGKAFQANPYVTYQNIAQSP